MGEFLERLAARALGQASSVEPRMPSRYESSADWVDDGAVDEPVAPAPGVVVDAAETVAPPSPVLARRPSPPDRPARPPLDEPVRTTVPAAARPRRVVRIDHVVAAEPLHSGQPDPAEPVESPVTEDSTVEPPAGPIRRGVAARR